MRTSHKVLVGAAALALAGGVAFGHTKPIIPITSPIQCHAQRGGVLPDPVCTPGVANPDITQDNINQTICNPAWSTKSIRPPVSYTNPLKVKQIQEYGYADTNTADYEEDHFWSLEIGGSPTDPHNLWPESYGTTPGAKDKDKVENYLHKEICTGAMTLQQAQAAMSRDWTLLLTK